MTQTINIAELAKKVESMISGVRNGNATTYHTFTVNENTDNEQDITIRVSDHLANPARVNGRTIFFIVDTSREGNHISKKTFSGAFNADTTRIYLMDNNCDESGYDVEYLLDYELN